MIAECLAGLNAEFVRLGSCIEPWKKYNHKDIKQIAHQKIQKEDTSQAELNTCSKRHYEWSHCPFILCSNTTLNSIHAQNNIVNFHLVLSFRVPTPHCDTVKNDNVWYWMILLRLFKKNFFQDWMWTYVNTFVYPPKNCTLWQLLWPCLA